VDWKILLLTALTAFIGSIGQLEFKRGADNLQFDIKLLLTNYHLIIAIAVYCVSTVFYVYALNKEQLSILYPIVATSYIWTLVYTLPYNRYFLHLDPPVLQNIPQGASGIN